MSEPDVAAPPAPRDLTCILVAGSDLPADEIKRAVAARGYGHVLVRVAPLQAVGLTQVEVHGADDGLPREDPDLVGALSKLGEAKRAAFVHVNHSAKQAIVHGFSDGKPGEGFAGQPGDDFAQKLTEAIGAPSLAAIHAADDGSRLGIGVTSSRTTAFVRGIELVVPAGLPSDSNPFQFHDRGSGLGDEGGAERVCLFAFDAALLEALWHQAPGKDLAEVLTRAPAAWFGPLAGRVPEAVARIAALGDKSPGQAQSTDLDALELVTLVTARLFAGGEAVPYWDERLLPLFFATSDEPVIGADDVDELDETEGVLHAMAEVLPSAAPPSGEGAVFASLADEEIGPLAPWAKPGEEYAGSVFLFDARRLFERLRKFEGRWLQNAMEKFARAWYRAARPGHPEGDALETFRRAKMEESQKDTERFVRAWTELRTVLELAAVNPLRPALLFYEGAPT